MIFSAGRAFDSAGATAVVGEDGMVRGWSGAAEELLGYPASEVVDRPAGRLLAEPAEVCGAARGSRGRPSPVLLRHRDGRCFEAELEVSSAFTINGLVCVLVTARDVSNTAVMAFSPTVLERCLHHVPVGTAVLGPDLRCVWVNEALEQLAGAPRDSCLGRRMGDLLPGSGTDPAANTIDAGMRWVLETGGAADRLRVPGRLLPVLSPGSTMTPTVCSASASLVMDVTDRDRARERLSLLNEAGTAIGNTLEVRRTAQELADFAVPRLADVVVVDLLEGVLRGDEPIPAPAGGPSPLRRVARQSVGGSADAHERAAASEETGPGTRRIVVPMSARGSMLGVVQFVRSGIGPPFEEDDLLLAEELVARAALCVDNARRYTREHTAALALQRSLLPHALQRRDGRGGGVPLPPGRRT